MENKSHMLKSPSKQIETISFSGISFCGIILWNYEFHKTIFFVEFCTKFHKIFPQIWIFHKFILWNFFPQIKFCGKTKRSVFHISICGCVERRQSLSASTNILWWRNPALEPCRKLVQACMSHRDTYCWIRVPQRYVLFSCLSVWVSRGFFRLSLGRTASRLLELSHKSTKQVAVKLTSPTELIKFKRNNIPTNPIAFSCIFAPANAPFPIHGNPEFHKKTICGKKFHKLDLWKN